MLGTFEEYRVCIARPALLRRTIDVERFPYAINRARERSENIVRGCYIVRIQSRGIWLRCCDRTRETRIDAQGRCRACGLCIGRVPGLRSREIEFSADGERMRALRETECVGALCEWT